MKPQNLYQVIQSKFNQDDQSRIIFALRQDEVVWEAVNDRTLLDQLIADEELTTRKWSPAALALGAIGELRLLKKIEKDYSISLPEELLKKAAVVYQRVSSPVTKPKNLGEAGIISLWLWEKRRTSGSWHGVLPLSKLGAPDGIDPELAQTWQTILNILISFVPDAHQLHQLILNGGKDSRILPILAETILSNAAPLEVLIEQFTSLITNLNLDDQVAWLLDLNAHGHTDLVINIAQWILEVSATGISLGIEPKEINVENFKQQIAYARLLKLAGRDQEALSALQKIETILDTWSQSLLVRMVEADNGFIKRGQPKSLRINNLDLAHREQLAIILHGSPEQEVVLDELDTNLLDPVLQLEVAGNSLASGNGDIARILAEQAVQKIIQEPIDAFQLPEMKNFKSGIYQTSIKTLMALGMMPEAYQLVTKVLKERPNDVEMIALAASICLETGDDEGALLHANVGSLLSPDTSKWHCLRATAFEKQADWISAYGAWEDAVRREPYPSSKDLENLARCAYKSGEYQKCIDQCIKILEEDPDNGYAYHWIGTSAYHLEKFKEAVKSLNRSTSIIPSEVEGWVLLSDALIEIGERRKALDVLRQAVQINQDTCELNYKLARLCLDFGLETEALPYLKTASRKSPKDLTITSDLINVLYTLGFLQDARVAVENALDVWPDDLSLTEAQVNILSALGENQKVLEPLSRLIGSQTPKPAWMLLFAELQLGPECLLLSDKAKMDEIEKARQALERLISQEPGNREAAALLAEIYAKEGDYADAFARYKSLIDQPGDGEKDSNFGWRLLTGYGTVALMLGQIDIAIAALQEAVKKHPDDAGTIKVFADALLAGDFRDEGMEVARQVVNLDPTGLDTLEWFSNKAITAGAYTEALSALKAGIQNDPLSANRWLQMARIQTQVGDHDGASDSVRDFMKLVEINPDDYIQAAEICLRLGDHQLADSCFTKASENSEHTPFNQVLRACIVKMLLGDALEALRIIQAAVESEPQYLAGFILEADLLTMLGRPQAAMAVLEHAIELFTIDDRKDIDWDEFLNRHIDLVPLDWLESLATIDMAHARLSRLYEGKGNHEQASRHAGMASDFSPENLDHLHHSIRLAYTWLDDEEINRSIELYYKSLLEIDQTRYSQSRIEIEAFIALLAFLRGENIGALKKVSELVELAPDYELTKILEAYSLAVTGARDEATQKILGLEACINGGVTQVPLKGAIHSPLTLKQFERGWFIIPAALDLYAWSIVKQRLNECQNQDRNDPIAQLTYIAALIHMAEQQALFDDLDIIAHSPYKKSQQEELKEEIYQSLQRFMEINPEKAERWSARAGCLFNPNQDNIENLTRTAMDASDAAAIIHACTRSGSVVPTDLPLDWLDKPSCHVALALSKCMENKDQAIQTIQKALDNRPNDPVILRIMAGIYESNQEDRLAYATLINAIKRWQGEARWHLSAARVTQRLGIGDDAKYHAGEAYRIAPDIPEILFAYAKNCMDYENPQDAIKALESALDKNPDEREAMLDLLSLALFNAKEHENTIDVVKNRIDKYGPTSDSLWIVARALLAIGDEKETINVLRRLVRLDPAHEEGTLLLAQQLSLHASHEDALVILEKALVHHEQSLPIQIERCRLIWRLHGVHKTVPILKNISNRHPDNYMVTTMLAEAMEQAGDMSGAEAVAAAGLKKNPAITELNSIMGRLQYRAGNLDRAISFLSEAIRQSPSILQNYLDLAQVYLERREHLQALRVYQQAVKAVPNDPQAYLSAAKILRDCRDYVSAENMLRKAADLNPEDISIRRQLGAIIALNLVHHKKEVGSPS